MSDKGEPAAAGSWKMRHDEFEGSSRACPPPENLTRWRRTQREGLIADRLGIDFAIRNHYARQISERLTELLADLDGQTVSGYWPLKGEPDLRPWLTSLTDRGGHAALPVIVAEKTPLRFRVWRPGDALQRGIWNIPYPANGDDVSPDVVIAPLVGFDRAGYRLGYGGGYFDRTLAAMPNKPRIVGVGYGQAALKTIHPQPHDIPMDVIVTESDILEFNR